GGKLAPVGAQRRDLDSLAENLRFSRRQVAGHSLSVPVAKSLGNDHVDQELSQHGLALPAENLFAGRVEFQDAVLGIDRDDAVAGGLNDGLLQHLAGTVFFGDAPVVEDLSAVEVGPGTAEAYVHAGDTEMEEEFCKADVSFREEEDVDA